MPDASSDHQATERSSSGSTFDRFAEAVTNFVSEGAFFTISLVLVVVWLPTIVLFSSVDTWQLVINTATSVLAFLLIALLQNSERRYDEALHAKVDAIAEAVAQLAEGERTREGAGDLRGHVEDLRSSVGAEKDV